MLLCTIYFLIGESQGTRSHELKQHNGLDEALAEGISYVRSVFRFNCDWKKRLLATNFTAINEMVVTDRTDQDVHPIPRRDSFGERESLYDQAQFFEESDFWKGYNIIKPTESLEDAVDKLKKRTK